MGIVCRTKCIRNGMEMLGWLAQAGWMLNVLLPVLMRVILSIQRQLQQCTCTTFLLMCDVSERFVTEGRCGRQYATYKIIKINGKLRCSDSIDEISCWDLITGICWNCWNLLNLLELKFVSFILQENPTVEGQVLLFWRNIFSTKFNHDFPCSMFLAF